MNHRRRRARGLWTTRPTAAAAAAAPSRARAVYGLNARGQYTGKKRTNRRPTDRLARTEDDEKEREVVERTRARRQILAARRAAANVSFI